MNLIELYDSLSPVAEPANEKKFNAVQIPEFPNFRIGINAEENPVLLLSITGAVRNPGLKNIKLKYLQLHHNIECKIFDGKDTRIQTLTVITFANDDRDLQEHFLRISETLVKALGTGMTNEALIDTLNKFIEIFRSLSDSPNKTTNGLWAELFLIDSAANPKKLLYYWHSDNKEKFDFNSGEEKIEVKSNSSFERIHFFSSEQLNPPIGTNALIASVFIKRNSKGKSINQLVDSISLKIDDINLIGKLNLIVCKTLGNAIHEANSVRFDYSITEDSLRFYNAEDIGRIKENYIPKEVSDVKFRSDLSRILPIETKGLRNKGLLFDALN